MSYFINPVEEDQCVFLTYEGEMPPIEAVTVRYEAIGLLAAKRWNRIVVDVTALRSFPTAAELFEFARSLSSDMPRTVRVALVIHPERATHARLAGNFARNEGGYLSFFSDVEEAAAWVKEAKPREQLNVV
jgi:hypothetical protein